MQRPEEDNFFPLATVITLFSLRAHSGDKSASRWPACHQQDTLFLGPYTWIRDTMLA